VRGPLGRLPVESLEGFCPFGGNQVKLEPFKVPMEQTIDQPAPPLTATAADGKEQATLLTTGFQPGVTAIGFAVLALLAWLHQTALSVYNTILDAWMYQPFRFPFLDMRFVLAGIECRLRGIDVYHHDPCDFLDRAHNYSPLWLRFTFLPTGADWFNTLGISLAGSFLLAVGFLPQPKDLTGRALFGAGVFSYSSLYALERGNLDLLMFVFAVMAGLCLNRSAPMRLTGYAIMLLAGLLKFYPMAMLIVLLREKWRVILPAGAAIGIIVLSLFLYFHEELHLMAVNLPTDFPSGAGWGAKSLARGLSDRLPEIAGAFGWHAAWIDAAPETHLPAYALLAVCLAIAFLTAARLAHRPGVEAALGLLTPREHLFLLIGAALVVGCFLGGQSLSYRFTFMVIAFPGLLALARAAPDRGARRIFGTAAAAMLLVLWQMPIRRAVTGLTGGWAMPLTGPLTNYVLWAATELLSWWVNIVLLALLLNLVASADPARRRALTSGRRDGNVLVSD